MPDARHGPRAAAPTPRPTGSATPLGTPAAARACRGRRAARSSSPCCSRCSASPRSPRCAPTTVDDTYAGLREQDLIDVLNGLAGTTQRAEAEITRLERDPRRPAVRHQRRARPPWSRRSRRPTRSSILAGTVPVTGPGHPDHHHRGRPARSTSDTMLDTIQELRTAGAEAIQINGQVRVVAQTVVRGRRRRASWSTASWSSRRTSST